MKVIGARYYGTSDSARDNRGHGTHTASTAAGKQVNNVSFYSLAQGNARGAVPSARIAVYKVCPSIFSCEEADIMAAFDDAISDGVDMLSVSMGPIIPGKFIEDPIAIGSYHAMQQGILTSQAAGNDGYVISVAPWVLTVAAGTLDRLILDKVVLADRHNTTVQGSSINPFNSTDLLPVVSETQRINKSGKILFMDRFDDGEGALAINASGLITCRDTLEEEGHSTIDPLPAAVLNSTYCKIFKAYMKSRRNPMARILKSKVLHDYGAPAVAVFSSRGPNRICKDILKPDVIAPGSDIIAAWPPVIPPSRVKGDKRSVQYSFLSGTSMSCPHATGAAAYVKSFHPDWTPSAIKSALMTTAFSLNSTGNQDAEFGYGAGHIDPVKAVNPGLVYEAGEEDYIKFLCSIDYTAAQLKLLTGRETSCPKDFKGSPKDLNYPSFVVGAEEAKFTRTVTNVGMAISTYKATITSPPNWDITVTPNVLSFKSLNEKQSFIVTVSATAVPEKQIQSASLLWSDGVHKVKSPIVLNVST